MLGQLSKVGHDRARVYVSFILFAELHHEAAGMWGQLSNLGQALKEQAEAAASVAREAGLDRQLVSIVATLYSNAYLYNYMCQVWGMQIVRIQRDMRYCIRRIKPAVKSGHSLEVYYRMKGKVKAPKNLRYVNQDPGYTP